MKLLHAVLPSILGLLAACAASPAAQQARTDRVADYRAAAGASVGSFTYVSSLYSWEPLDEHSLVVYTRPRQAWLLTVTPCPELPYTNAIGLSSHVGQVSTGLDSVRTGRDHFDCRIQRIQSIDLTRMHAAQAARRQIETMPRPADAASPSGH